MITWLEQEGKVKTEVKKLYRGIYHAARPKHMHQPDKVFEVKFQEQNDDRSLWQKAHNKAIYIDPVGKEVPKKTIRAKPVALQTFEESFASSGYAVIDKLLTDGTMKKLQQFLQASTFYFYPRKDRHLMALLEDGLASPLLAQLADGLRLSLPALLGPLPLTGARAWKADNSPLNDGVVQAPELTNSSADAAVSMLLWTVPASALNGTAAHALELRRRREGADDDGSCAAAGTPEGSCAEASGEPAAIVKYLANRAVLWGPGLTAEWTGPGWQSGFLQRGVHLLLTFGWTRCP